MMAGIAAIMGVSTDSDRVFFSGRTAGIAAV